MENSHMMEKCIKFYKENVGIGVKTLRKVAAKSVQLLRYLHRSALLLFANVMLQWREQFSHENHLPNAGE